MPKIVMDLGMNFDLGSGLNAKRFTPHPIYKMAATQWQSKKHLLRVPKKKLDTRAACFDVRHLGHDDERLRPKATVVG